MYTQKRRKKPVLIRCSIGFHVIVRQCKESLGVEACLTTPYLVVSSDEGVNVHQAVII